MVVAACEVSSPNAVPATVPKRKVSVPPPTGTVAAANAGLTSVCVVASVVTSSE